MRLSGLFGATLREAPSDVLFESHRLLIRAGFVRQLAAGIYSLLPLAWRSIHKIEQILREEMVAIGAQEVSMPVVHPAELWQKTGRWQAIDETMVRFKDRNDHDMLLAMTHEEVVAELARSEIQTYRQLPRLIFQLQTKFRDEPRARGGMIRVREFVMKDSYSLDLNEEGLRKQYLRHYKAYLRIGARSCVPFAVVRSDVGMMGGKVAHEFMYLTEIGEDTLAFCDSCKYAANREVASFQQETPPAAEPAAMNKVHTPGAATIEEVAKLMNRQASEFAKMVCFMGDFGEEADSRLVVAIVRGDREVNAIQVQNLVGANQLRPAQAEELKAAGITPGFGSPIGMDRSQGVVVVDELITKSPNLVSGANEADYHLENTNYGRDYEADKVGSIALVYEGAPCPTCGSPLQLKRGVEVGNIFQLGTRYTAALDANYVDEKGVSIPIVMGSYGIGVGRLLGCVAEEHHDEKGLALPISIAPYQVHLIALGRKAETNERAEQFYQDLQAAGFEVLFDDRQLSPGIMFADADLLGMPIRVLISDRSLKGNEVEMKIRTDSEAQMIPIDRAIEEVKQRRDAMLAEIAGQLAEIDNQVIDEAEVTA